MVIVFLMLSCSLSLATGSNGEIDQTAVVNWVEDGDTFNVTSGETVRLADIDTPEIEEEGYYQARSYMINLLKLSTQQGKTVYLDIDDVSRTDSYGRLVCVVFIDYNSTHHMNVNKALIQNGYAVAWDHNNNEFNPSNWQLYVQKDAIPEFPSFTFVILLMVTVIAGTLFFKFSKS